MTGDEIAGVTPGCNRLSTVRRHGTRRRRVRRPGGLRYKNVMFTLQRNVNDMSHGKNACIQGQ
jgi:hypothetical protein